MYTIGEYVEPNSLAEAKEYLAAIPTLKPVAGGTDLLLRMAEDRLAPYDLLSLRKIAALKGVRQENGELVLGPLLTFSEIRTDKQIGAACGILQMAAGAVAGPQIRNIATIGGNLCNGAPSADSAPSLLALEARLQLEKKGAMRIVPLDEFYLGPKKVDLHPGELLTAVRIPLRQNTATGACYIKYSIRKTMDISMLGCAAILQLNDDGTIARLRLALGTAAPTPVRCKKAEEWALNQPYSEECLNKICELAALDANPRTSWRATRQLRLHLAKELTHQAVVKAKEHIGR